MMSLYFPLTHEQLETHGYELSTVATDALVLMHQAISSHSADQNIHCIWPVSDKRYHIYREQC